VESTGTAGLEARSVVAYIMQVRSRNEKLGFEKFAVLYRTNAQSLPLQVEFILNDIPYWVREEDNVLENDTLVKFLAVLRVRLARREGHVANARDSALLIGSYFRFISDTQLEKLERLFQRNDFDIVLGSESFYQVLPKARSSRCREVILGLFSLGGRLSRVISYLATEFKGFIGTRMPFGQHDAYLNQCAKDFGAQFPLSLAQTLLPEYTEACINGATKGGQDDFQNLVRAFNVARQFLRFKAGER
jgi:hypothetical protein